MIATTNDPTTAPSSMLGNEHRTCHGSRRPPTRAFPVPAADHRALCNNAGLHLAFLAHVPGPVCQYCGLQCPAAELHAGRAAGVAFRRAVVRRAVARFLPRSSRVASSRLTIFLGEASAEHENTV